MLRPSSPISQCAEGRGNVEYNDMRQKKSVEWYSSVDGPRWNSRRLRVKDPDTQQQCNSQKKQAHHLFIRARLLFGRHLVNPLILTGWPIDRHMESHTLPFFFFRRSSCVRKVSRPQINPIIQSNCRNSVISSGCQLIHANFGFTLFLPKFHPRRSKEVLHTVTATPEAITESARI